MECPSLQTWIEHFEREEENIKYYNMLAIELIADQVGEEKDKPFLDPEKVNPADLKPGDRMCLKTTERVYIATIGWANDWTAYEGTLDWSAESVASGGDKISQKTAERLFPVMLESGLMWRN